MGCSGPGIFIASLLAYRQPANLGRSCELYDRPCLEIARMGLETSAMLFAVAHAVQLEDGSYAVRSSAFPGCEARSSRVELAREQFGDVLRDRLLAMIAAG